MIKIGDYWLTRDMEQVIDGKIRITRYDDEFLKVIDSGEFDEKDLAEVIDKFFREKF